MTGKEFKQFIADIPDDAIVSISTAINKEELADAFLIPIINKTKYTFIVGDTETEHVLLHNDFANQYNVTKLRNPMSARKMGKEYVAKVLESVPGIHIKEPPSIREQTIIKHPQK
jgi:hypothetical protein